MILELKIYSMSLEYLVVLESKETCKTFNPIKQGHVKGTGEPTERADRLGPGIWDPLLQCLHLDKRLVQQQNTKKL